MGGPLQIVGSLGWKVFAAACPSERGFPGDARIWRHKRLLLVLDRFSVSESQLEEVFWCQGGFVGMLGPVGQGRHPRTGPRLTNP